ncbi:pyruvate kinase [Litorivicinus lipolyticus]|uniref:Pyruvate kinase n=1 Tax=Litorivicinus lipolyticus TaxID=418701 RepID=A0A5Q2QAX0_9GAMM|nr:pyruvate kinase [Litorivicinus lipolyticus]QGG79402.1 pyruvate kinase [Litorivicinus lipolyticus]
MSLRRTKIVATLGPSTDSPEMIDRIIKAGVNCVRLNFSHGEPEDHRQRAEWVRKAASDNQVQVAILADLQGPKIRIARFADGHIELAPGDTFVLDASLERDAGTQTEVGIDYKALPSDCTAGDLLLLDDGRITLRVQSISGERITTVVERAGTLSNNKGINRQGGGLSAPALTQKDLSDLRSAVEIGIDYIAVSFPRSAADMREARREMKAVGGTAGLIAKIERAEAVADEATLDAIIRESDGVMVARGDLGVEIGDAHLVGVQKRIIARARALDRIVITATQMMESMISSSLPTRAEVFDVANAVLDGTDAVMLSGETAAGSYPVETVEAMARTAEGAEVEREARISEERLQQAFTSHDEAIALSAMYAANRLKGVAAILCLTESGSTPRWMSRIGSHLPIIAMTREPSALGRMALYRGVFPVALDYQSTPSLRVDEQAIQAAATLGYLKADDLVIFTKGDRLGLHGGTNTMKILRVGDFL